MEINMNQIVTQYFDDSSLSGEDGPKLVLITGGTGSGKTTQRKLRYSEGYVLLDAGDIFKIICNGNDIEYNFGKDFIEEMEEIGQNIADRAIEEKRNIVMEVIGDEFETMKLIINSTEACGYKVQIEYIHCDVVEAYKRHLKGAYEFLSCYFSEPYHTRWLIETTKKNFAK